MNKQPKQTYFGEKKSTFFSFEKQAVSKHKYLKSELKSFSKINNFAWDPKLGPHGDVEPTNAVHPGSSILPSLPACLRVALVASGLEGALGF